ncbi:MAG: HIT domain-containing protein [Phycisphaerae bacterium]|nr:HIT domain-containing protein [Phycisphaerae bacterium]
MSEFHENLWAPWRMEYIRSLADEDKEGCFLCSYRDSPEKDAANHVLWRTRHALVVMNRFPYTNGHLLISPYGHKEDLADLDEETFSDLWRQTRDAKAVLGHAVHPNGFNIGINLGLCAGAGLPGHLHVHVVPRWTGDTNFMAVLGDVRVVPESLRRTYEALREVCVKLGIPPNRNEPST